MSNAMDTTLLTQKIQELEAEVKVLQLAQEQDKETVRGLSAMNEVLKGKLNEQVGEIIELKAEVFALGRAKIIAEQGKLGESE